MGVALVGGVRDYKGVAAYRCQQSPVYRYRLGTILPLPSILQGVVVAVRAVGILRKYCHLQECAHFSFLFYT